MSDTRLQDMQRMRHNGFSDAAIGRKFGLTRQRVHALLGSAMTDRRRGARVPDLAPVVNTGSETDRMLPVALATWRARHNLTQQQAAEILHLSSVTTYSKWERGLGCALSGLVLAFLKLWESAKRT